MRLVFKTFKSLELQKLFYITGVCTLHVSTNTGHLQMSLKHSLTATHDPTRATTHQHRTHGRTDVGTLPKSEPNRFGMEAVKRMWEELLKQVRMFVFVLTINKDFECDIELLL
jgi:hypothetical protein